MKRIVIVDDEHHARELLKSMVASLCPDVRVCGEAAGVDSACHIIRQEQPHAILLDISLEDGTGFDLLERFPQPAFQVVFTTAFDEFALKAFRYHAQDYLLKPINPVELSEAMERVGAHEPRAHEQQMLELLKSVQSGQFKKITLTSQEGLAFLNLADIVRLESDGNYTTFHTSDRERHLVSRPMRDFEELLSPSDFFRIHQSHIVQAAHVKRILRDDGGIAVLSDDSQVPIARRRKDQFMEWMHSRFQP